MAGLLVCGFLVLFGNTLKYATCHIFFVELTRLQNQMKHPFIATTIIMLTILSLACSPNLAVKAQISQNTILTVTGTVNQPLSLTLADLQAMPKTTVPAPIICVDAPNTILEQGNWAGVKVSVLLEKAGITVNAVKIGYFASDGYSTDLTIGTSMRNDVILAYQKDDQTLSGLRLVVPGNWGYKWINQVSGIVAYDFNYLGKWESLGYADDGTIVPNQSKPGSFPQTTSTDPPSPSATSTVTPPPQSTAVPTQTPNSNPDALALVEPTQKPADTISRTDIYAIALAVSIIVTASLVVFARKRARKPSIS
jgi:DMSO/TMAO reductase YedYZ molybdopterin-dependent catalytic subunit